MTRPRTPSLARLFVSVVAVLGLAAVGAIVIPMSASAATFSVTSTADTGAGSLRAAVALANTTAGADTITFALPANSIIQLQTAIDITESTAIDGSGTPGLVLTGQGGLRHVRAAQRVAIHRRSGFFAERRDVRWHRRQHSGLAGGRG